jgi:hypothetical protein
MPERENNPRRIRPEPIPEGAMDSEIVAFLMQHIDNPCSTEVTPGDVRNIRDFYIQRAKELLPNLTNEHAKIALELKILEYQSNDQ